jgi:prepilin-type N-terminal cleavage/methylation domain-containing protein
MIFSHKKNNSGFTLIEMIVSLGVFSVVVTIAVGAILVLISTNQKLQAEQSVMTNLAFALDTMTREIRTGYNYYCVTAPNNNPNTGGVNSNIFSNQVNQDTAILNINNTTDCPAGRTPASHDFQGLSFYEGGDSITGVGATRILYFYDANAKTIMRRVGSGDAQAIVSSGLVVQNAEFYVTGTDPLSAGTNDTEQPTVTIYIEAQDRDDVTAKSYYLETTVTQRILDI